MSTQILQVNQLNNLHYYDISVYAISGSYYTFKFTDEILNSEKLVHLHNTSTYSNYNNFEIQLTTGSEDLYNGIVNLNTGWHRVVIYDTLSGSINESDAYTSVLNDRVYVSGSSVIQNYFAADTATVIDGMVTHSLHPGEQYACVCAPASGIVGLNLSQIASGSATASISPNEGLKINIDTHISGGLNISGSIQNAIYGITSSDYHRIIEVDSSGSFSADEFIVQAYISPTGSIAGYLSDLANWNTDGVYIGPVITDVFQGQKHCDLNYLYEAIADNSFIRINRNLTIYNYNYSISSNTTIASIDKNLANSAFFDYYVKDTNNYMRAGVVATVWDGINTEYTDTSTNDLNGSTQNIFFTAGITGSYVNLLANIISGNWNVKITARIL